MSLRFLPVGTFLYLIGGMVFGFGVGFTSTAAGLVSLVSTGIGAVMIVLGYFVLRPLLRRAKTEIKGVSRKAAIATPETSSE